MQKIGAAVLWLTLATVVLGACVRAGASPPKPPGDGAAPADAGDAKDTRDGAEGGVGDGAPDGPQDGATSLPFDPAANACLIADAGPFVERARFKTPNAAYGVWYVAPHLLVASTFAGLYALSFDGAAFTQRARVQGVGWAEAIWNQGDTVYLSSPGDGLRAYRLAQTGKLTLLAKAAGTLLEARRLWGDASYLYVPAAQSLQVLRFDGASFSQPIASVQSKKWAHGAWTDGKRVYLADGNSVRAFTFDGKSLAEGPALALAGVNRLWGHGDMLYAGGDAGVAAVGIGSGQLTLEAQAPTAGKVREVWSDGVHVFAAASAAGIYALRFTGSALTQVGRVDTDGASLGVVGDGTYIYVGDTQDVIAYAGFACRSVAGGGG